MDALNPLRPTISASAGPSVEMLQNLHISLTIPAHGGNKYPAKQHARKVASKLGISHGLIYLIGKPTVLFDDSDQAVVFRQRRYFYYLSGVDSPDCHLTYDVRSDLLTLYVPDFDLRQAVWMGPTLTIEEAMERFDIDKAKYVSSLPTDIDSWLQDQGRKHHIYILHPDHRPPSKGGDQRLESESLRPAMNASRGVKDATEIELIRRANIVSGLAHTAVLEGIGKMTKESEIAGLFLETCMTHGAPEQAYGIIAASGENASVLHYMKNDEPFGSRPLVCLDAGAEFACYASDVTRTFPTGSTGDWPTPESRSIYRAVERMQEECIQMIKPGVRFGNVHVHAHRVAIEELLKLGIFHTGSVEEIEQARASVLFMPHGLGHHVGLEVHDVSEKSVMAYTEDSGSGFKSVPGVATTLATVPLEENMVVTVEPGIYFNRLAIENARKLPIARFIDFDLVEKYIPVGGVRIEDDILVTADGYENLTTAPKGEKALEIIRNSSGGR